MHTPIVEKIIEQLQSLPQELQWRVFEFTKALVVSEPRGVPGAHLLRFAGTIPSSDVQIMREAIEQGCQQG